MVRDGANAKKEKRESTNSRYKVYHNIFFARIVYDME